MPLPRLSTLIPFLALALTTAVDAENILKCGVQPYYPSQYTCYNGFLCPIINGVATLKCADACYLSSQYTCTNGKLSLAPPPTSNLFSLRAFGTSPQLQGRPIQACGQRFVVGPNATQACTYCPDSVARTGACAHLLNSTVLAGSSLFVEVPGGQAVYVDVTSSPLPGVLGFTQAHSAYQPSGASNSFSITGLRTGERIYVYTGPRVDPDGGHWLACPIVNSPGVWQVFAQTDGGDVKFQAVRGCYGLDLEVVSVPAGSDFGAWQFV